MKTASVARDTQGDTFLDARASNSANGSEETCSSVSNASKLAEMIRETTLEVFVPLMLNLREKLKKEKKEALVMDLLGFFGDLIKENKNEISRRFHSQQAKSVESEVSSILTRRFSNTWLTFDLFSCVYKLVSFGVIGLNI